MYHRPVQRGYRRAGTGQRCDPWTRIIFPSNEREVTVRLTNEGKTPGLIQAWLDDGDVNSEPDEVEVPFTLTPPLFRLEPAKGQTLRLIYNKEPLAQDKETLFWLNVLEIPPQPENADAADATYMQMAFRIRIKMLFRPHQLNSMEDVLAAPAKVTWKLIPNTAGAGYVIEATNPTPYHVNLSRLGMTNGAPDNLSAVNEDGGMIAPGQSARFVLKELKTLPAKTDKLRFTFLNDYGGGVDIDSDFSR